MLRPPIRPVAHAWIPVVGGIMMVIGLIIAITGLDGPAVLAYQQIILGAMLFGLGFLSCTMWALLSKKSEPYSVPTPSSNIDRLAHSEKISGTQEAEDKKIKKIKENQTNPAVPRRNLFCESCGVVYNTFSDKFCGKCGSPRI